MRHLLLAAALLVPVASRAADKAPELPPGYRALSVPFAPHQLRFVEAGDRVDVMVTFDAEMGKKGDKRREPVTATILQNVVVLAVDRAEGLASLVLNPNEAQYAALFARKDNSLWIGKRSKGDTEMHPMEMAAATKLFR